MTINHRVSLAWSCILLSNTVVRVEERDGIKCNSDIIRTVRAFIPRFFIPAMFSNKHNFIILPRDRGPIYAGRPPYNMQDDIAQRRTILYADHTLQIESHRRYVIRNDFLATTPPTSHAPVANVAMRAAPCRPWHTFDQIPSCRASSWETPLRCPLVRELYLGIIHRRGSAVLYY